MEAPDLRSPETKFIDAEIAKGVERERERCAKIADEFAVDSDDAMAGEIYIAKVIADKIRNPNS